MVDVIHAVMVTARADKRCSPHDQEVIIAAIVMAWFYLLRSSEYCEIGGETRGYCLTVGGRLDVEFYDEARNPLTIGESH